MKKSSVNQVEVLGTFESSDSASQVARALNSWFLWIMEGGDGDCEVFDDFGLSSDEYQLDLEEDTDWEESPQAEAVGNLVTITAFTSDTIDLLQELMEGLGAYEVEAEE